MKALLVNGSPHKAGCTHTALALVGDALRESYVEADEFWIGAKPIAGCIGCYKCAAGVEPPAQPARRIGTNFIR